MSANIFFDDSSSLCLVRKGFSVALGLVGRPCMQTIITAGGESKDWDTMVYSVPLIKINGDQVNVLATALERITTPLMHVDMGVAARTFAVNKQLIARPVGEVDLLIGIHLTEFFPVVQATNKNLQLLKYQFGSGFLVDGAHPEIKPTGGVANKGVLHIDRPGLKLEKEPVLENVKKAKIVK